MWPSADNKLQPNDSSQPTATNGETPGTSSRSVHPVAQNQHSLIGASIKIKGTITASDPVYIYGTIEGSISAPAHRVTIGREGKVKADISAREVVIMGEVSGNLDGGERVEIRSDGSLTGDLVTRRIYVEDGATLSGSVDIQKPKKTEKGLAHEEQQLAAFEAPRGPEPERERDLEHETWADLAVSEIA
jgi:cytoskeletal protein CcmA (bactofilin family)